MAAQTTPFHGKPCRKCGGTLRYASSGNCVACVKARNAARNATHREEKATYNRAYYAANRERLSEHQHIYNTAHHEEQISRFQEYYAAHREERAAYDAAYYAEHRYERTTYQADHREDKNANNATRRARKASATVEPFTSADLAARMVELGDACIYCGGPHEHDDHFVPLSRGGEHALANLVPACTACNLSKGSADPWDWMARRNITPAHAKKLPQRRVEHVAA